MRCVRKRPEVLAAIQIQSEEEALRNSVRGQYQGGKIGDTEIPNYRKTEDVNPESTTETYVALKLTIDNWRWAGVPFYLRTGKALGIKRTGSRDQVQAGAVRDVPRYAGGSAVAKLSRHLDRADRRYHAAIHTKVPGPTINIDGVEMKFRYKDYFKVRAGHGL